MHVALVSPYDLAVPGGVQAHVTALAHELLAVGDDVTVISPGVDSDPPADAVDRRIDVVRVGATAKVSFNDSQAPLALWPAAAYEVASTLKKIAPEVVHVHEPAVPWVSLAATVRSPAPVVGTFHAWSDSDRIYRMARPVIRPLLRKIAIRLAVSPAARDYHAGALGWSTGSFRVVPNAVHVSRFRDAEPFPRDGDAADPTLLFVGRIEKRKGLATLIAAFLQLKASRPDLRLLVVGDGPERDECQAMLPGRLRDDVTFLGRVEADDLPRWYRSADVYVAPALGGESFGIVLLEAMAAGTAVVASDIPGYRTVVDDRVTGMLADPGDPSSLAGVLAGVLDGASLRGSLVAAARDTAKAHDWPIVASRVREAYRDAIRRR